MSKKQSSQKRKVNNYYDRQPQSKIWFLRVCEGKKTEPNYFRKFPVDQKVIKPDIKGEGKTTKSLVEKAIELKQETENYNPDQDQIWCVFDRDKNPKNSKGSKNFNDALKLAKKNELKVAYSNDAFELWYIEVL